MRTKQFELVALREAAKLLDSNNMTPIMEPVRSLDTSTFKSTLQNWFSQGKPISTILNPKVGEVGSLGNQDCLGLQGVIPAVHVDALEECQNLLNVWVQAGNSNDSWFAIMKSPDEIQTVKRLVEDFPGCTLFVESNIRVRTIRSQFREELRTSSVSGLVRLEDGFVKEARNADYENGGVDYFSDEIDNFEAEGMLGFADYTVLGSSYQEGGFQPRAVAIHWTFKDEYGLQIVHFVSEDKVTRGNVRAKFLEVAPRLVDFIERNGAKNEAYFELKGYCEQEHFPGLGVLKKISLLNHLLIAGI